MAHGTRWRRSEQESGADPAPDPRIARRIETASEPREDAGGPTMTDVVDVVPDIAFDPSAELAVPAPAPAAELVELWFRLAQRDWASLALVPADAGSSAASLAQSLAEIGRRLRDAPVTAITPERLEFPTASALADCVRAAARSPDGARVVVAVPPLVVEPLGTAAVQAADAVILCVELGHTRLEAARRTLDLVGRERVVGALLLD